MLRQIITSEQHMAHRYTITSKTKIWQLRMFYSPLDSKFSKQLLPRHARYNKYNKP